MFNAVVFAMADVPTVMAGVAVRSPGPCRRPQPCGLTWWTSKRCVVYYEKRYCNERLAEGKVE